MRRRQQPDMVSVIIPYYPGRRHIEYVDTWINQMYPANRYELIYVLGRSDPFAKKIEKRLRAHDTLIVTDEMDINARFAVAVEASRGELLLFSEDHVAAEPFCIERLTEIFVADQLES
jgi:hypothetical protein